MPKKSKSSRSFFDYQYSKVYWAFCFMLITAIATLFFVQWRLIELGICIAFSAISGFILWQRNRFNKYWEALTIIFVILVYCGSLYLLHHYLKPSSVTIIEAFFLGYAFCQLQQILQSIFDKFTSIIKADFALLISRILLIPTLKFGSLLNIGFFAQVLLNFLHLFTQFDHKRTDGNLRNSTTSNKEELKNIKERLFHHISDSILVLDSTLTETLYANSAFKQVSNSVFAGIDMSIMSMTKCLHRLQVDIEKSFCDQKSAHEIFTNPLAEQESMNLAFVLTELNRYALIKPNPVTLKVLYNGLLAPRRIYEVKIFAMPFNNKPSVVLIFNDVTEKDEVLCLRASECNKDRIISTVSHEFRTPLNGILGILSIIEKTFTEPELHKYVLLCKNNASLLLSVANTMLDAQQIREGKLKLYPTRVEISQMMEEIRSLFEFQCSSKDIYLKTHIHSGVPKYILTDINRLKQVLINLTGNAIKFTFEGGITLDINVHEKNPDCVKFSIIDTGLGIEEQDKQKLFKMFGKLEKTDSINKGGTGLGLMISDTLARLLNIRDAQKGVTVESDVGKGSVFSFLISKSLKKNIIELGSRGSLDSDEENVSSESIKSLDERIINRSVSRQRVSFVPSIKYNLIHGEGESGIINRSQESEYPGKLLYPSHAMSYNETEHSPINSINEHRKSELHFGRGHKRSSLFKLQATNAATALVVDDNAFNIMVATHLVQSSGFRVETAFNGKVALEKLKQSVEDGHPYKVVLMDCEMPIMDGYQATLAIKSMIVKKEIPFIPVIALTAHDKTAEKKKCLECGMIDVLVKPINEKKLMKVLEKIK